MAFVWKAFGRLLSFLISEDEDEDEDDYYTSTVEINQNGSATLDVILPVLPIVGRFAKQLSQECSPRRLVYDYLGHTEAAAGILQNHLTSIRNSQLSSTFETDIVELAGTLESFFSDNVFKTSALYLQHRLYPRLRAVQALHLLSEKSAAVILPTEYLARRDTKGWKALSAKLASLTDRLQQVGHNVKEEKRDRRAALRRPGPEFGIFIDHAISAMTCTCKEPRPRDMRLRLATYMKSQETEKTRHFTLLSRTMEDLRGGWAEVRVHEAPEFKPRETDIKFVDNGSTSKPAVPSQSFPNGPTECLCQYIRRLFRSNYWRLNLKLTEHQSLSSYSDECQTRTITVESLQHQVDIKSLISSKNSSLTGMAKMILSVILAYSLFHLYGRTSIKGGWNRNNIVFFADGNHILLRPFLKLSSPIQDVPPDSDSFHQYPEFLELGVTLLEVYFGESLESMLGSTVSSPNECLAAASEVFDKKKLDIMSAGFRQAIEICLKTDLNMGFDEEREYDADELRNMLFESVVQPLEQDLQNAFPGMIAIDSLDEEAPVITRRPFSSFAPVAQPRQSALYVQTSPPLEYKRDRFKASELRVLERERERARSLSKPLQLEPAPAFELFSVRSPIDENPFETRTSTDNWMERFQRIVDYKLSDSTYRLKVAILDTGIDLTHQEFYEAPIKEYKSWVNSPADMDSCGHGTHIASTILTLCQNVDLYIGKITNSNILEDSSHIGEAIQHASEEWDVDIISLSFGFPKGSRSMQSAIDEAVYRNKIIFAAASNDAANSPRAYPAQHGRVICVHSATGEGNRSKFNPTEKQNTDNFCVVGEQILAAWPSPSPDKPRYKRMSGTSFATPVAVAIAVFMITFVSERKPEHKNWLIKVKSFDGVRAMFRILSESRDGNYDLVNPIIKFEDSRKIPTLLDSIQEVLDIE